VLQSLRPPVYAARRKDGRVTQVLLVGADTARLEVDLAPYGLSCHVVNDAQVAVDTLKQGLAALQPWTTVVVGQHLPDMTGPAFVDGLVRHFDPANVVLLADVEPQIAQLLSGMPKVSLFPSSTDGVVVADHLFKRLGGAPLSLSTSPAPSGPSSSSSPPASLASLFDAPRTGMTVPLQQQTPAQAFAMPAPGPSSWAPPSPSQPPSAASWGAPSSSQPPRPTTMPFFQALSASAPTAMPVVSSMPSSMPSMPPMSSGPDRATLARMEAMAAEIASVNAELVTTRARLQAAEQRVAETAHQVFEREAESTGLRADVRELQTELDMVRQAVASDVAEISALADDGVAAQTELENLRTELQGALVERDGAVGQLEMVRAELDQLSATLDGARRELSVAHADIEQQRAVVDSLEGTVRAAEQSTAELQAALALATEQQLANDEARRGAELVAAELAMTQGQLAELQGALALAEQARETLASESEAALETVKAQLTIERERVIAAESERQQLLSELEAAHSALGEAAGVRAELDIVRNEKLESETAWAQEQQKVIELEARVGESQAAHLDSESRLQGELAALQQKIAELEAVAAVVVEVQGQLKEAERHAALEEARADRAVADATGMRQYIEAQTHEQARIVGEIEQLRPIASEVERARAAMVDMQRQLEAGLGTDELDGSTEGAIEEGARARTRELLELARAIEPFAWGLDQAAAFFAEANVDGATRHIQAMRLLQKTLERLKNELDRLHQT